MSSEPPRAEAMPMGTRKKLSSNEKKNEREKVWLLFGLCGNREPFRESNVKSKVRHFPKSEGKKSPTKEKMQIPKKAFVHMVLREDRHFMIPGKKEETKKIKLLKDQM